MLNGALSSSFSIPGKPIGAVRQTQADRWKNRPCVLEYREWCDAARLACTGDKDTKLNGEEFLGFYAFSHSPMPESWSKKKKALMAGQMNTQKPDKDNIEKAIGDALFDKDQMLCMGGVVMQYWCMPEEEPRVDVFLVPVPYHAKHEPNDITQEEENR